MFSYIHSYVFSKNFLRFFFWFLWKTFYSVGDYSVVSKGFRKKFYGNLYLNQIFEISKPRQRFLWCYFLENILVSMRIFVRFLVDLVDLSSNHHQTAIKISCRKKSVHFLKPVFNILYLVRQRLILMKTFTF